jgi:precorrin isomerase
MQIGGTLVNAVVRIAIVAATLALAYFFVIKPVLSTTETVTSGINGNIQKAFDDVNEAFDQSNIAGTANERRIKRKINATNGINQDRLITCIQNAQQDVNRIQRCANRFGP